MDLEMSFLDEREGGREGEVRGGWGPRGGGARRRWREQRRAQAWRARVLNLFEYIIRLVILIVIHTK